MGDLPISKWITEIHQTIHEILELIEPLERLGKHAWAKQLADEVRRMREAIDALQRLRAHRTRVGRPLNWLREISELGALKAKPTKRKRTEK